MTQKFRSTYTRIQRRELHSPRATVAIVMAVLVILVLAWIGTEIVLALLSLPALLVSPLDMATALVAVPSVPAATVVAIGVLAALVGILLLIAALAPGRRARHVLNSDRSVTIVDNEVIASAIARYAARAAGVDADGVRVSVSKRLATVRVVPASGTPVDTAAVDTVVREQIESYGLAQSLRSRVVLAQQAKVGG